MRPLPQRQALFRLCANTVRNATVLHPQSRDSADVLEQAISEMAIGSKLAMDATKKLPGEGFKRP